MLVNEDLGEITVLQSKHRERPDAGQGDADLRNLVGAAAYFETVEAVDGLLRAAPNLELRRLLERLEIRNKVAGGAHATRLVFVTNGVLDPAGRDYVDAIARREPPLEVWDADRLAPVAQRTRRPELLPDQVRLRLAAPPSTVILEGEVRIAVGLVPASQLAALPGIEDLSLFDRNVRLSEGRTRINKELAETIQRSEEHALFPAFHNGLTMLTHGLEVGETSLDLHGITVVNGCQSLLTLHDCRDDLTDELSILVKVVQVERQTDLPDRITYRSNNQNPVDIRDQRSTDVIQRDLQAQVRALYGDRLGYAIRQGERIEAPEELDNKTAAQFLMAVYLGEPWSAVRKVRLFDEDYRRIFNRTIDAHKLLFVHEVSKAVDSVRTSLAPQVVGSFASVRATLAHLLVQVLRQSDLGAQMVNSPERWLPELIEPVREKLTSLAQEVVESVNFYLEEEQREKAELFDPKVVFKSQAGVRDVENQVLRLSRRLAEREAGYLFNIEPVR